MSNPLLDKEFLLELDKGRNRETYVRLTALTFDEHPLESIEGRATQGSINLDGKSAVRRTCSLSLVADKLTIHDFYWSTKSKFKLEIGIKNFISSKYSDIIWFPFGIYIINSFSTSQSINNFTVSISGKDKMCMLNGEVGGHFNSSVDLGTIEYTDKNDKKIIEKYPIKNIIREMVHQYGNEPFHNIIINDLDEWGIILEEYRGDTPLYLLREENSDEFRNMTLNEEQKVIYKGEICSIGSLIEKDFKFDLLNTFTAENYKPDTVQLKENGYKYLVAKIEYGQTPGYTLTDLTYASDLIAAIGDSITTILDKIVQMLGNFEYFYDIDGRFIFQKKQSYKSTNESIVDLDGEMYSENAVLTSAVTYSFDNSELIQSISNNPNIMNVKNDFSVWGTKRSVTGQELPVHMRYAIDKKPVSYTQFPVSEEEVKLYNTIYNENMPARPIEECKTFSAEKWDWRELIYQMAKDYRQYNHLDGFEAKIALANPDLYPTGKTGYEQYYIDMEGFWRQLYNPDYSEEYAEIVYEETSNEDKYVKTYTLIDKDKDTEYEKYYIITEEGYLIKYIDSLPLTDIDCYIKNGEEYQSLINTLDLDQYTLYTADKKLLSDTVDITTLYIENSVGRKIPVRDAFNIFNIDGDIKEDFFIYENNTKKIITFIKEDESIVETVNDIRKYWQELYYKTNDETEYKEVTNSLKVYVERNRDITDKVLYIQEQDGDYVSFNNSQSASNKLTYLIKTDENTFISITNLLKPDRSNLYYKENNEYKLLINKLNYKDGLYKENFDEYINIKNLDDNLKSLYYKNDKYEKYLWYATYNYQGKISEYYPLVKEKIKYYEMYYNYDTETYWHNNVKNNPEQLNFWIDFLDLDGELDHFSVPVIGNRSKPINDSNVKAIYFRDTPNVLFTNNLSNVDKKSGYTYIQLQPGMQSLFNMSSQGKSAKNVVEEALYNYAYCADTISLTTIPIYYLQPNTRIFVRNDENFINGEYIIDKISIPLAYNSLMSISANKAIERILY